MRLGILCMLAAVAAALAQRRGAEAGDPTGLGIGEGNNKAADTLCDFGGRLEAAALAAEAVTAQLAAGARAAAGHAAVLEAARALTPRQAGTRTEARETGAPLIDRLDRALLTKARLNEAYAGAQEAAHALARAAQEVRTLLGLMGSLVDKSARTTQSCLAKDGGLATAYAGDADVEKHLAKVCEAVFGRGLANRKAEQNQARMTAEEIAQALGALMQKEGESHPDNGTCIAHETAAAEGDCAGRRRSKATQVNGLLGDAEDASECPLLVKASATKYGLAIKQHTGADGTLHIGTFIMAKARASAKSTLTLDTDKPLNAKEGWTLKEILAKLTKAADTLGVTGDNDTCKGRNAELCSENDKSIELAIEHVTSAHRVARRKAQGTTPYEKAEGAHSGDEESDTETQDAATPAGEKRDLPGPNVKATRTTSERTHIDNRGSITVWFFLVLVGLIGTGNTK
ncbi:hypothetical protein, conserved in T. vivax [Trypanosoma vivax Y486]|uniref:Uncharacterized protein n=1 Tax=Trypanosoma vivax (strain Y486) TaxID=1055687 RepID=F9WRW4_TRYVY|nr:hypothetical protein, conserved in T. vivax [Trypanosoma vivax Y486]|eukprot:CCD20299.1 hypothetical protein, conserved in T. vivax [Trypanosoma vivax Y486]